jgi:hypothetical protein
MRIEEVQEEMKVLINGRDKLPIATPTNETDRQGREVRASTYALLEATTEM